MPPLVELTVRMVYFRLGLEGILQRSGLHKENHKTKMNISDLEKKLSELGVKRGDSIMVHSRFSRIDADAGTFIDFLKGYIGEQGNILMPTHPKLAEENGVLVYDVDRSPSTAGYLTERFRLSEGVERSLHPFSSIAAWGKDKAYFLENNLDHQEATLPHGKHSPYYRFCLMDGKVLCIGITAIRRATISHVAEEVLDNNFPVRDFFEEYDVVIRKTSAAMGRVKARTADLSKSQLFVAKSQLERQWLRNNIVVKDGVNGIPVELLHSRLCMEYMMDNALKGSTRYPYAPKKR